MREWIDALPQALVKHHAWLNYWNGVSLLAGSPELSGPLLETAYWRFVEEDDLDGQLASCSAAVLANHSDLADFRPLDTWVSRLTGLIAQSVPFPSPLAELQSNTALAYYAHVRKPNAEFYDAVTHRALQLLEADIPVNDRVVPACLMLHSLREAGRMADCSRIIAAVQPHLHDSNVSAGDAAYWWDARVWEATSRGDLRTAAQAATKGDEIFAKNAIASSARPVYSNMILAALAFQRWDLNGAEAHIAKMESYLRPERWLERGWAAWIRSIVSSMRDDFESAIKFARMELDILAGAGAVFHLYYAHLHIAGGLIGLRRYAEAHAEIEHARALLTDTFEFRNLADVDFMAAWLAL